MASAPFPADRCPLCGQANACAMEEARASATPVQTCWCARACFSPELLARIPEPAQRLACICARCARGPSEAD